VEGEGERSFVLLVLLYWVEKANYLYYCTGWRRLTTYIIVLGGEGLPVLLY